MMLCTSRTVSINAAFDSQIKIDEILDSQIKIDEIHRFLIDSP